MQSMTLVRFVAFQPIIDMSLRGPALDPLRFPVLQTLDQHRFPPDPFWT